MVKNNFEEQNNSINEPGVESKVVTVGSNQSHKVLVIVLIGALIAVIYYFYSSSHENGDSNVTNHKQKEVTQDIHELKEKLEQVPESIPIPERELNNILPPLPPIVEPSKIPEIQEEEKKTEVKQQVEKEPEKPKEKESYIPPLFKQENVPETILPSSPTIGSPGYPRDRRNAGMMAISGSGSKEKDANASAQQSNTRIIQRLDRMVIQGKIIDTVLETAISSDFQGPIRAMVTRDVYAEAGDKVLIPKGSRLIGGYSFDSNISKARININWNRVILPHGIDVTISSPGIDEIGRVGVTAIVDNKILSALASSILLAGVSISSAIIGQKASSFVGSLTVLGMVKATTAKEIDLSPLKEIIGEPSSTEADKNDKWKLDLEAISYLKQATSEKDLLQRFKAKLKSLGFNSSNITLDNIKQLMKQQGDKSVYENSVEKSINDFSKDMKDIVERVIDKKPTVYVDQGTALKVFVNQDIIFPLGHIAE